MVQTVGPSVYTLMPAAAINRVEVQREPTDCGIVALAMYLGVSYEDVLRAVSVTDRCQGRGGLWTRTLQRVSKRLGHTLKIRRRFDLEDYGVIRLPDHAAVLRSGLVLNTDGTVWDADEFLSHQKVTIEECQLLVAED
jgi:hypothetical protein